MQRSNPLRGDYCTMNAGGTGDAPRAAMTRERARQRVRGSPARIGTGTAQGSSDRLLPRNAAMTTPGKNVIESRMLTRLDRNEFAALQRFGGEEGLVATLLLPMERKGPETRKNVIVFKNALKEAQDALRRYGGDDGQASGLAGRLEALDVPPDDFWQHQERGLAMLVCERGPVLACLTPFPLGPFVFVGRSPYLGPLLRLTGGPRAYVLLLDLGEVRLFEAERWRVEEVALEKVPRSIEEAMRFDDPEKSLQNRRVTASNLPGPGGGQVAFHGHGITGDETQRKQAKRFFERLDKGLAAHFADRETPLLLFGPDAEIGLYREVNHYPHLAEDEIRFNAGNLGRAELETMIKKTMASREARRLQRKLGDLRDSLGQGTGTVELGESVKGAVDGRVATLLVKDGEYRYGRILRDEDRVELHEERQPRDEELVGAAALATTATGGEVVYMEGEELPEGSPVGAIFRF